MRGREKNIHSFGIPTVMYIRIQSAYFCSFVTKMEASNNSGVSKYKTK
jgi:hypothetical protein